MWMMGYNDSTSDEDHINKQQAAVHHGSGSRRVQRALVPRPPASYNRCHDLLPTRMMNQYQYQHQHQHQPQPLVQPQPQMVVVSSRWNPTPEQLQRLEELYRGGTRTPSADEIQHITAHLRRFGKIEGKNVFYWFQNHKARERQKRRRLHQPPPTTSFHTNTIQLLEVEETRNWAMPALSEKSMVKGERTRKAADEGWIAAEEGNHDRRRKTAIWNPSSSSFSSSSSDDYETLELFPVNNSMEPPEKRLFQTTQQHFIEFLPLKK